MIDVMKKLQEIAEAGYDNEDIQRGIDAAGKHVVKKNVEPIIEAERQDQELSEKTIGGRVTRPDIIDTDYFDFDEYPDDPIPTPPTPPIDDDEYPDDLPPPPNDNINPGLYPDAPDPYDNINPGLYPDAPEPYDKINPGLYPDDTEISFGTAFKQARAKHGGPGGKFTYKGKEYQTNVKGEEYVTNPVSVYGEAVEEDADNGVEEVHEDEAVEETFKIKDKDGNIIDLRDIPMSQNPIDPGYAPTQRRTKSDPQYPIDPGYAPNRTADRNSVYYFDKFRKPNSSNPNEFGVTENEEAIVDETVEINVNELAELMQLAGYTNYAEKVEEYANEPEAEYMDAEEQLIGLSGGLNGPKKAYAAAAGGDNPMKQEPQAVREGSFDSFYAKYDKFVEELSQED
jgi:hypothetical protein